MCPCYIGKTHYPMLEKPGVQNIAQCVKTKVSNLNQVIIEHQNVVFE